MKPLTAIVLFLTSTCLTYGELTVFAASSLTDVMKVLAKVYEADSGETVHFNFAGTGTLARQIEAGAPADVFIAANARWMDLLQEKQAIMSDTRFDLAGNRLVLVAPTDTALTLEAKVDGKVAVGDFRSVPAGMYAKEALEHMGWLEEWKPKLIMTSNVRAILLYVERGEVEAGIVYATDAAMSKKLKVVGTFPIDSHSPIVYPAVSCADSEEAVHFLTFLKSEEARSILTAYGFACPP
jgi:molybdate transport system substrate-binding protein